ncbi:phospholipase A2, putative [Medicago truncatula]|nr:phospholipase A2, putative [Medicago truncatula]
MTSHINILRATAAFALLTVLLSAVFPSSSANCGRDCIVEQCNSMTIKYGRYCGVGYSGCPGVKPCDDIDACCMGHDDCVGRFGVTHVKCHKRLKNCLIRVQRAGKVGFSKECPVSIAAPTMIRGMDLAIMFSSIGKWQGWP